MTPRRILALGWLVFVVYAFPGFMRIDEANQLVDLRYNLFSDIHSPMMGVVWWLTSWIVAGPPGMIFLQSLLLLLGTFVLARRVVSERAAAIVACAVLLVPTTIATTSLVCSEAQLASWLVAGSAAVLSERFRVRLVGLGLLLVAAQMHSGGALAVLPPIAAGFVWRTPLPRAKRMAVAAAAWIAILVLGAGVTRAVITERTERDDQLLAMVDIIGILEYGPTIDDAHATQLLSGVSLAEPVAIQKRARAVYGKELFYAATDQRVFEPAETDAQRDALFDARSRFIRAYPTSYLVHRWHYFYRTLGIHPSASWDPVTTTFVAPDEAAIGTQHQGHHSLLQRALNAPVEALADTFVFQPVIYFVLALLLVGYAAWRRYALELVVLVSGLLYELTLMFTVSRAEFRDSHPMIVTVILAACLLVARYIRRKSTPAQAMS